LRKHLEEAKVSLEGSETVKTDTFLLLSYDLDVLNNLETRGSGCGSQNTSIMIKKENK
jgi:hypothetical protein